MIAAATVMESVISTYVAGVEADPNILSISVLLLSL